MGIKNRVSFENILPIKSKIIHWLSEPKWLNRLALYFLILLMVCIISHSLFSFLGFLHTDVDSARYMLSALIQSEATILAIVITLSLVAVQLAASSYSARIIDLFKNNPDFWLLIAIYAIAIIYGLGVLKQINSFSNLENYILSSYYLGIFALVALIPYILNTLKQLKPSTTIKMLAEKITKQNITVPDENGPLQLVIDIVRGSLMKYDYETVRDGL